MQPVKRLRTQSWDAGNSDAYQSKVEHVYASRTVLNFLSERERYYPIFERICLFLPVECLCALSCVSKGLAGLQKDLRKMQWNVDKKLRRFVRNPQALRSQLGQEDAVISGSFAVQFFDRVTFPGSDLDIYVTIGSNADTLGQYLMDVEEYQLVNQRGQEEYNECTKHIWERDTFTRRENEATEETKVQIIKNSPYVSPIITIIGDFYTTAVINIVTSNKAYSLFPLHTFVRHNTYLTKRLSEWFSKLLLKYSQRGWETRDIRWPEDSPSNHGLQGIRRIGDRYTWVIPFETRQTVAPKTPDYVIEHSEFWIREDRKEQADQQACSYRLLCERFINPVLRHQWIFPGLGVRDSFWFDFVGKRLNRLCEIELYKREDVDEEQSGTMVDGQLLFRRRYYWRAVFDKPAMWAYHDEKVAEWYEIFERLHG